MNFSKDNMLLYAVTDRAYEKDGYNLYNQLEDALKGGVTCVQIREKNISDDEFYSVSKEISSLCKKYNVPLLVNDNIKIAKEINADGVHIGQDDMSLEDVRKILGDNKIIGVTVHTKKEAEKAILDGADYLGIGAMFSTFTKTDVDVKDYNLVKEICEYSKIPVVAIGGINYNNMEELKGLSLDGIALVSEIFSQKDIKNHCKKLLNKSKEVFKK